MSILTKPTQWFVKKFIRAPRLWSEKEWNQMNHKEKLWVWYKHQWLLIGTGAGEIGQITSPIQSIFLYSSVIFLVADRVNNIFKFGFSPQSIFWFLIGLAIIAYFFNMYLHWRIGKWKDEEDLIAFETEIVNKRNFAFRYLRNKESLKRWKKIGGKKNG